MRNLPFRANRTWLIDDDLILLDVLFDGPAPMRLLRRDTYRAQWNLGYSHGLNDADLEGRVTQLGEQGVLKAEFCYGETFVRMTAAGGELWSHERCPEWERYCTERYHTTLKGRTLVTVVAVSPQILDDFLRIWPMCPARRRTATIRNYNLISWRTFPRLHVGTATYNEECEPDSEQEMIGTEWYRERQRRLLEERSWWRCVSELQRFIS
jgi:hypothetical protein